MVCTSIMALMVQFKSVGLQVECLGEGVCMCECEYMSMFDNNFKNFVC